MKSSYNHKGKNTLAENILGAFGFNANVYALANVKLDLVTFEATLYFYMINVLFAVNDLHSMSLSDLFCTFLTFICWLLT